MLILQRPTALKYFMLILFCFSCQNNKETVLPKNTWECQNYSNIKISDNSEFLETIKNERKYWIFKSDSSGKILNRETVDELTMKSWKLYEKNKNYILEIVFRQRDYWINGHPEDTTFIKTYLVKTLTNDSLILKSIDGEESYTFISTQKIVKYIDTTNYERLNEQREERIRHYTFKKMNTVYDVANDSARIWGNGEDGFDLIFEHSKLTLWFGFLGQCTYEFPVKIENDKLVVYWDTIEDCVFESGMKNKFGLIKYPHTGDKFMSLKLINDSTLKANYFFLDWVNKFNKHQLVNGIKRFETYSGSTKYLFPEYFKFEKEESKFFIK